MHLKTQQRNELTLIVLRRTHDFLEVEKSLKMMNVQVDMKPQINNGIVRKYPLLSIQMNVYRLNTNKKTANFA